MSKNGRSISQGGAPSNAAADRAAGPAAGTLHADAEGHVTPAQRSAMIAEAAYLRAEARSFEPGHALEDWLAAEREVDERLAQRPLEHIVEVVKRERDELRVKMHLARLDVREEWDALEQKWQAFRVKSGSAAREARASGREIGDAAHHLLTELREGYRRIRGSL